MAPVKKSVHRWRRYAPSTECRSNDCVCVSQCGCCTVCIVLYACRSVFHARGVCACAFDRFYALKFPLLLSLCFWLHWSIVWYLQTFRLVLQDSYKSQVGKFDWSREDSEAAVCIGDVGTYTGRARVFRRRSRTLVKLSVKLGTALLIEPVENCPISSPV